MRILANWGEERIPSFPDVPTFKESGFPDVVYYNWAGLFVPKGVPWPLLLLLVPIEIISYFIRPFSLSIRLFANMLAGHTMLKVFGGFVVMLGIVGGWAPLAFIVVFTGLELLIAFLQAYVFAILTCLYLNDAVHLHH